MKHPRKALKKKGWSEDEIAHTERVFAKARRKQKKPAKRLDKGVFWMILLTSVLITTILGLFISTLSLVAPPPVLLLATILLALAFGMGVTHLLNDHALKRSHHYLYAFIIFISSIIVFLFLIDRANQFTGLFTHHGYLVAILFCISFLLPYGVSRAEAYFS